MFIPRGKMIHENLATSYVQVDALVADLGEGGFSGVVEVVLRDTDSFVIISAGRVAAVVERRGEHAQGRVAYTRATIEQLAERARLERGRVSIYGYPASTAAAVAGRINARPLYVGLSTEFTDLEKMIWKLVRERDREWFIEIYAESAPGTLIHMRDGRCRILNSELAPAEETEALDLMGNTALARLLDEGNRAAASFDVYFRPAAEADVAATDRVAFEAAEPISDFHPIETPMNETHVEAQPANSLDGLDHRQANDTGRAASGPLTPHDMSSPDVWRLPPDRPAGEPEVRIEGSNSARSAAATGPMSTLPEEITPRPEGTLSFDMPGGPIETEALALSLGPGELSVSADAEAMAEIKRLMGEIARTIEQAAQAVDRPESFSMSLRAGQLKIADRYPFLDPFAGEIEYLAGEIVFVGHATTTEFIAGLTEALKLAVAAVTRSTSYAVRFRAYVTEDLQKLLAGNRAEFESFGLDRVIEQITGSWNND